MHCKDVRPLDSALSNNKKLKAMCPSIAVMLLIKKIKKLIINLTEEERVC